MKQIFIDTNVIIDFLANRQPFSDAAAQLFELAKQNKIKIYISAISINNTYYILRKVATHNKAIHLISEIGEYIEIQDLNRQIILKALRSDFGDFEDAIQYFSAMKTGNIDIIATRNEKDFKKSEIPVMAPDTIIKLLLNEGILNN
jgi:predicted nucleic acid-binding protein